MLKYFFLDIYAKKTVLRNFHQGNSYYAAKIAKLKSQSSELLCHVVPKHFLFSYTKQEKNYRWEKLINKDILLTLHH